MKCPKCQLENPETSLFCSGCGANLDAAKDLSLFQTETLQTAVKELSTGSTFAGRYQIIEELGKGGMGKVYRVLDKKLNEEVALKLIRSLHEQGGPLPGQHPERGMLQEAHGASEVRVGAF